MNKWTSFVIFALLFGIMLSFKRAFSDNIVNIYGWYGIINRDILDEFEKETGVKVVYDVYDNNDTLEAKLLATNSGYDVVFPSFIPYAARQESMGAYLKLDKAKIPNLNNIKGWITDKFTMSGGNLDYLVPIFYGTTGIAYNDVITSKVFPNESVSLDTLINPNKVSRVAKYGVSMPEESVDIFPILKKYLGLKTPNKSYEDLHVYMKAFSGIRKYIKKFSTSTMINDLLSGEVAIAIGSSDNAWRAIRAAYKMGKRLKYKIPDGGMLWIDCVCIPSKAPHKDNALKFLNFLLRPDIAARITNESGILTNIPAAIQNFRKDILNDDQVCPTDPDVLMNLNIGGPSRTGTELNYDRAATRTWSKIKSNEIGFIDGESR